MSDLTITRRQATRQFVEHIKEQLQAVRLEGDQTAEIVDELHDCSDGSLYQSIGSVDLNDVAGRMHAELAAHMDGPQQSQLAAIGFGSLPAELDALTIWSKWSKAA